eukprot:Tbor_TRINITY_DN3960_c0_g1::TRINITY_DN3960_c0_g1_i1::g.745::m.745/K06269/PPP1C; serine/threonine-protein phosphatase PP1 catalytic subunit
MSRSPPYDQTAECRTNIPSLSYNTPTLPAETVARLKKRALGVVDQIEKQKPLPLAPKARPPVIPTVVGGKVKVKAPPDVKVKKFSVPAIPHVPSEGCSSITASQQGANERRGPLPTSALHTVTNSTVVSEGGISANSTSDAIGPDDNTICRNSTSDVSDPILDSFGRHHLTPIGGAFPSPHVDPITTQQMAGGSLMATSSVVDSSATSPFPYSAHYPKDYLYTCRLCDLPSWPNLSLHYRYDVLEALVERIGLEYLSKDGGASHVKLKVGSERTNHNLDKNERNKNQIQQEGNDDNGNSVSLSPNDDIIIGELSTTHVHPYAQYNDGISTHSHNKPYIPISQFSHRRFNLIPAALVRTIVLVARDVILANDSLILQLPPPVNICGDLHGQLQDLLNIFSAVPPCGGRYLSRLAELRSRNNVSSGVRHDNGDIKEDESTSVDSYRLTAGGPHTKIERNKNNNNKNKYLFLGDYVDRGEYSVEVMVLLLSLKILAPNEIYLLRGNHESSTISRTYGFYDECVHKYRGNMSIGGGIGLGEKIWKTFLELFLCLPVTAIVGNSIFCTHGGIPRDVDLVKRIMSMPDIRPYETPNTGFLCDLVWADPDHHAAEFLPNSRKVSHTFNMKALDMFLTKNKLQLVCRAHQVMEYGYGFFPGNDEMYEEEEEEDGIVQKNKKRLRTSNTPNDVKNSRKLVTLFSASNYANAFSNCGAMMIVNDDMEISFKVFEPPTSVDRRFLAKGVDTVDARVAGMWAMKKHVKLLEAMEGATFSSGYTSK